MEIKNTNPIKFDNIKDNKVINAYLLKADDVMKAMGYTEHGLRHAGLTSNIAKNILQHLEYPAREVELASIAAYMHDIGNCIAREGHSQTGAVMTFNLLTQLGASPDEIASIIAAIGNHEEYEGGHPINPIAAAIILADKTDVHRTRVRNTDITIFDIHDRVNYAAIKSFLRVISEEKIIKLELAIDPEFSPVMEYFEIFLERMMACKRAAKALSCAFSLEINKTKLL